MVKLITREKEESTIKAEVGEQDIDDNVVYLTCAVCGTTIGVYVHESDDGHMQEVHCMKCYTI